jgi:hypothetical protein
VPADDAEPEITAVAISGKRGRRKKRGLAGNGRVRISTPAVHVTVVISMAYGFRDRK